MTEPWHQPIHSSLCNLATRQIAELAELGWCQEAYDGQHLVYEDWNKGVWDHKWTFARGPCDHCRSVGLAIRAGSSTICKACLTQYPQVPWHPTGIVHPKWMTFVYHSTTCPTHEPSD